MLTVKSEALRVLSIQTYDTSRTGFVNCVLCLIVGKNGDLLTGLLVDVNATSGMPSVWKNKSL